jgi:hypothetical protein
VGRGNDNENKNKNGNKDGNKNEGSLEFGIQILEFGALNSEFRITSVREK